MPCKHGKTATRCKDCGGAGLCKHGRQKYHCKECGGGAVCKHGKRKSRCKECAGKDICEHNKLKYNCVDCGGGGICEHGKRKTRCIECGGSELCEHKHYKTECKLCGGKKLCSHGKRQTRCVTCNGKEICEHKRVKSRCVKCNGCGICIHGKRRSSCKDCGGIEICIHQIRRSECKQCEGTAICKHKKYKTRCKECGGSELCKSSWCETIASSKYDHYCVFCYIHLFPNKPLSRNYKTKEKAVVDYIKNTFDMCDWLCDKQVPDGCSKRRPDMLLDLGNQVIIIEIDENQHQQYDCSCENKRLMEISQDLNHRPVVFIRFNPDNYIDVHEKMHPTCWSINKQTNLLYVRNKKAWSKRLKMLTNQIDYWLENTTLKTVETVELFYDQNF